MFLCYGCADPQQWHLRCMGGGRTLATTYQGTLAMTSGVPFDTVSGVYQQSSDSLTLNGSRAVLTYKQAVIGRGQDDIDFTLPRGAQAVFTLSTPTPDTLLVGSNRSR